MYYKNLTIIGTSHISIESIKEVQSTILNIKPDIIALELDSKRFYALTSKNKKTSLLDIKKIGLKGYLFNLLGSYLEKKLGKLVGISPGSEMLSAIKLAKKLNIKLALVDQDIEITLKNLSKAITWREKLKFLLDIITIPIQKNKIEFDLKKVPSEKIIKKLIAQIKKQYPSLYKTLIYDRDIYIAKSLYNLISSNPEKKVIAIVGAGHESSILKWIKNAEHN